MNENIKKLMNHPRCFQEYLQNNGVALSNEYYLNGKVNSFSVNDNQLKFKISEYYTTASLKMCLLFILPDFTPSEINQVISMFEFHHRLFCVPPDENEVLHMVITDNHITFSSKIIELQVTKNSFEIYQECSFFESAYNIKKVNVESFQKVITKQLKKSLALYFKSDIKKVTNQVIKNVLDESLEQYNNRINQKDFFKKWTDHDFYTNIHEKLSYVMKSYLYEDEEDLAPLHRLENKNIAVIKNDIEHSVMELFKLQETTIIFADVKRVNIIRTLFKPIFIEKELDYLISIISLMNFIEEINNPYESQPLLFIEKEPTLFNSKEYVFCTNYIFNISVGDFSLNIGRETEISSYSLYEYNYKSDKLKSIYNSLVNLLKKELSKSLNIPASEMTNNHIKLQQMKNS